MISQTSLSIALVLIILSFAISQTSAAVVSSTANNGLVAAIAGVFENGDCINDTPGYRILRKGTSGQGQGVQLSLVSSTFTVDKCVSSCQTAGYKYAGVEYGSQCFCGNSIGITTWAQLQDQSKCNIPCPGDSTNMCGGNNALNFFYTTPQ